MGVKYLLDGIFLMPSRCASYEQKPIHSDWKIGTFRSDCKVVPIPIPSASEYVQKLFSHFFRRFS